MHVFSNEVAHKCLANPVCRFYTELNLKAAAVTIQFCNYARFFHNVKQVITDSVKYIYGYEYVRQMKAIKLWENQQKLTADFVNVLIFFFGGTF